MADPQPDKIEEIDAPVGERKREAWDKLRGYQYQVWFAILLWLRLPPDEDVFIETAEDADQASVSEIIANQLKDRVAGISLNNAAAMEALSNFWTLRDKNPQRRVRFNYITTGDIQQEQSRSFKDGRKGLEVWEMAKTDLQDSS
jgi:hypothetical protein